MDEEWKKTVTRDMKICNEARVRLEEHDKAKQIQLDNARDERMELFEHKNVLYNKVTKLESNKVSPDVIRELTTSINTLKTEKKFLPYIIMIVTALASLGTLVYVVSQLVK